MSEEALLIIKVFKNNNNNFTNKTILDIDSRTVVDDGRRWLPSKN